MGLTCRRQMGVRDGGVALGGRSPDVRIPANDRHSGQDDPSATPRTAIGLREGEIAVELPERFDASLYFIGRIRTPWKRRAGLPEEWRENPTRCAPSCSIRAGSRASRASKTASHVVAALLDGPGAARPRVAGAASLSPSNAAHSRCARRCGPNPIAVSVARLARIDGNKLSVVGLDCLDDTPLLDIKPYFASTDSVPDASVGWHAGIKR